MEKFLGILVTADDVENEGMEAVFSNIEKTGAQAICITPWISQPVAEGQGGRLPDLRIDGHNRRLDRSLFGDTVVYLESGLSYLPDSRLYASGNYPPPASAPIQDIDKSVPRRMIDAAHKRGVSVHMELCPFLPPGLRDGDRPRSIDGRLPQPPLVADRACLNSPESQAFALALIEDTVGHYPELDGLVLDWAEFGAYSLVDHFSCFCEHCQAKAGELHLDWELITREVRSTWEKLHNLSADDLHLAIERTQAPFWMIEWLGQHPGWVEFFRLKALSVTNFYRKVRSTLDRIGQSRLSLTARGWPAPFNLTSGMDYDALADTCAAVAPKIFTFDHTCIPRWYGEKLVEWNPHLPEGLVLDVLILALDLPDQIANRKFSDYQMPAPGGYHPIDDSCYLERINHRAILVADRAQCVPFVHAYRNEEQWRNIISIVRDSQADGMWVQMYGYLSDQKINILSEVWNRNKEVV
jgi:hypothetical protein